MEAKAVDPNINLEEFIFQIEKDLPTGSTVHDEIGVSWEIIAEKVYICSRNDVKKYAKLLPRAYYTAKQEEATKMTMDIWDKVILAYQATLPHQEQRRTDVEKRWKQERPRYEKALNFAARFRCLSDDELEYIREQTKEADYTPAYDEEYDVLDVAYDEIAASNKSKMLEKMEAVLEKLPIEQSRKLEKYFIGYAALAYIPLVACISVMTESAKRELKRQIDSVTANTQEQLQRATYHAKELVDCYGIRQGNNVKLRGGWQTVWYNFEEKTKGAWYLYALRMAALVLVFKVWEWKDYELEMLMEYTFFLNDAQQREVMSSAKELLAAGEIQSAHTIQEIRPFIIEATKEQEIIERYFELDIADEVYDW